jgi:kynurenine 3-monooxygenase
VFEGMALIGDAAHAMYPFIGQGLNAGLEDASVLLDCMMAAGGEWSRGLSEYQSRRKPNCDAVTEIAAEHYRELAQATRDPKFVLRKQLEVRLGELFPEQLSSAYHIVSFSDRPYVEALRAARLQNEIIDKLIDADGVDATLEAGAIDGRLKSYAREVLASENRDKAQT